MPLHNFTFSGSLIVNSAKVEHTMHNHTEQLALITLPCRLRIGAHSVKRDQNITSDSVAMRIVESNHVRIIVMAKKFPVGAKYLFIATETIIDIAYFA